MSLEKITRMEKEWIRMSMPTDHGETCFRLLRREIFVHLLERDLNVCEVLGGLLAVNLISFIDYCDVRALPTNRAQLDLLLTRIHQHADGPGAIEKFLESLRKDNYHHAATTTDHYLHGLYARDYTRQVDIKSGLVPTQPQFYVVRKELVYKIKDNIIAAAQQASASEATHWIVIHGMAGNGKSYLAAAALRSPEIWKVCFGDGIYWLDIGKPGTDKLFIKLGVLWQMVNSNRMQPGPSDLKLPHADNMESICQSLANAFVTQHPNSVLVLDDVWDEAVIKAFEKVACRCIIVTSRRKDIVKSIHAAVTYVNIDSGFTLVESQEYFAQILKVPVANLPHEAVLIHKESKGSPMVMSLVGGMAVMTISATSPYEHRSIGEAIKLSVDSLKFDLREKFFDFAIFDDGVPIPISVFTTLWSIQTDGDAGDEMAHFVNSSLCTRDYCAKRDCIVYRFHDLILVYARNNIPIPEVPGARDVDIQAARENALQNKHRKLFHKYQAICEGHFQNLPDDYYIHNFIGYHMSQGKMIADIKLLYSNRAFLDRRLIYAGPEVVLVDLLLLQKQHPSFTEQLEPLVKELNKTFDVKLLSPDIRSNRRSAIFDDFLSRRGSNAELDVSKFSTPDSGIRDVEVDRNGRSRSQSSENALRSITTVHSEPNMWPSRSLSRLEGRSSRSSNYLEDEAFSEDKENGHREEENKQGPPCELPKVKMSELRNDNFDEDDS
ncbi:putative Apoptotic protease-activating factor 1 [Hypsibius exemplaris]|uniref:Apoptotic protease-activating factor 1 n=1 Tax=Hypsibius exemplaris TaxID=2072580 RepID=A0A1W0WUT6_HYPEX|nr:putative Apoptotic protease-activating factor 1 [Hypsibius exemplaris]